jgi:XTP/dITP diphosphohydrolase
VNFPDSIVLASGNQKKLQELARILSEFKVELIPQSEFGVQDAVEDGLTFVENAIKKARHACQQTGKPAIADDSGIEVDYLQGAPGIYSARFAGDTASDQDNLNKLLDELQGVPDAKRTARYQCVIVYMRHALDPTPLICQAAWKGRLLHERQGDGGFGYDPIFYCPISQKTAAQMSASEKAAISHRGKALAKLQQLLKAEA